LVEAKIETYSLLDHDPLQELERACEQKNPRMVMVCNPNNPTGTLIDPIRLKQCIAKYPEVWFCVDEAYVEFSEASVITDSHLPENLVVMRTFSKAFGLAALRFGFLMAHENLIEQLGKIRGPYDINTLAAVAAKASLDNIDDVKAYAKQVMTESKPMVEQAFAKLGCPALPSRSNFLLIPSPPEGCPEHLNLQNIRVRHMSQPELKGAIRISIGNLASTQRVITALETFKTT
jgi:histidinol-phosphate aminotransferase